MYATHRYVSFTLATFKMHVPHKCATHNTTKLIDNKIYTEHSIHWCKDFVQVILILFCAIASQEA